MKKLLFLPFLMISFCYAQTFRVSIADSLKQPVVDGRLLLLLSKNNDTEPRFQVNDAANTQMVFGVDVNGWLPGSDQLIDMHAFGYPVEPPYINLAQPLPIPRKRFSISGISS